MKKIEGQEEITEKNDAQEIERAETEKKVKRILDFAKKNKKITYGDLAAELDDLSTEQMERVFDALEKMGVDIGKDDDLDEEGPDEEDLQEVEDLKLDEIIERKSENKWLIDTVRINEEILQKAGLRKENIIDCGICSVCNSDLIHSYRVEKEKYGLSTAIIGLK